MPPNAMGGGGKAKAKASRGRAKAQAKVKARAQHRVRRHQLASAHRRQALRRDAIRELNQLCDELLHGALRVPVKSVFSTDPKVERLVRSLEPRCQSAELAARLRAAVSSAQWQAMGPLGSSTASE